MKILGSTLILITFLPCISYASDNFRYLGFEFNKVPQKEVIKDYTCRTTDDNYKECYLSTNGRKYTVILDRNDLVRKVSQSISTSSYKEKFSCLDHLKSYVNVLNSDYSAGIKIPTYSLFSDFSSVINVNGRDFRVDGNCDNMPEDVIFNAHIEDIGLLEERRSQNVFQKQDKYIDIKRDFQ